MNNQQPPMSYREKSAWISLACVLFSLVVAGLMKFGGQIVLYRRDA